MRRDTPFSFISFGNGVPDPCDDGRGHRPRYGSTRVIHAWSRGKPANSINTKISVERTVSDLPNTKELREQIEAIDEDIIDLIATRMEIADELAKAKKKSSQGFWDEGKEHEVVQRYHELCEEVSLSDKEAEMIAEVILQISKERQKHIFES